MDSQKPERWLSVKEFGFAVGWGEDTIRRLIRKRIIRAVVLPQFRRGKGIYRPTRIAESEVPRFLKAHSTF
jgi:hypothetical protein